MRSSLLHYAFSVLAFYKTAAGLRVNSTAFSITHVLFTYVVHRQNKDFLAHKQFVLMSLV